MKGVLIDRFGGSLSIKNNRRQMITAVIGSDTILIPAGGENRRPDLAEPVILVAEKEYPEYDAHVLAYETIKNLERALQEESKERIIKHIDWLIEEYGLEGHYYDKYGY